MDAFRVLTDLLKEPGMADLIDQANERVHAMEDAAIALARFGHSPRPAWGMVERRKKKKKRHRKERGERFR